MSSYKTITILEGPDGAGKTTLLKQLVEAHSYEVATQHFGPMLHVTTSADLARLYCESMWPALYQVDHVILDRCWLSEVVYGNIVRKRNRLLGNNLRMLERSALMRDAQLILCLPPVEACLEVYRSRREEEYVEGEETLRQVHTAYQHISTSLPTIKYDYTKQAASEIIDGVVKHREFSAARAVVVFDEASGPKPSTFDSLNMAPMTKFNEDLTDPSWRLSTYLAGAEVSEASIRWVRASDLEGFGSALFKCSTNLVLVGQDAVDAAERVNLANEFETVITLGSLSRRRLDPLDNGLDFDALNTLTKILKEILDEV